MTDISSKPTEYQVDLQTSLGGAAKQKSEVTNS
jgi:hypothetical protein